jgi:hypothetical protein
MEFSSPKQFAAHLVRLAAESHEVMHHAVNLSAEEIKLTARGMIGQYQEAVGPYPKWEDLADSTEAEKARLGYSVDAPLLRTADMQKSIEQKTVGAEAAIGSNDQKMIWHELGTEHIPPRPVLGPAAMHSKDRVTHLIGKTVFAWLSGKGWVRPRRIK